MEHLSFSFLILRFAVATVLFSISLIPLSFLIEYESTYMWIWFLWSSYLTACKIGFPKHYYKSWKSMLIFSIWVIKFFGSLIITPFFIYEICTIFLY